MHHLGFRQTYYGQAYHFLWFDEEVRRAHRYDPQARLILVGCGCGAAVATALCRSLARDGIEVESLVLVGGQFVCPPSSEQLTNVRRVINVIGRGCAWPGCGNPGQEIAVDGAEQIVLPDVGRFALATHPVVLEILTGELLAAAAAFPDAESDEADPGLPIEQAPTPRPVAPPPASPRDEWDFLKPVKELRPIEFPPPSPPAAGPALAPPPADGVPPEVPGPSTPTEPPVQP
ncbi:MAG: hypothetical protein RMJ52_03355 [Gemmataceae bacterium]|nr:hypothetical protein [Gemmataceae bacterium]